MEQVQIMIFFIVFSSVILMAYTYIGRRLIKPSALSKGQKRFAWIFLLISPFFMTASFLFRTTIEIDFLSVFFGWTGYILFGFFSIVLAFVLVKDLFLLVVKIKSFISAKIKKSSKNEIQANPVDLSKREFLMQSVNMGILGFSGILTGYGIYEARRNAILEKVNVPINNLPSELDGFKIAQFTDIHAGPTIGRKFIQSVVEQVNELGADIIVFTGDLVDGSVNSLKNDVAPLLDLQSKHGKFFITGNHEYYSGVEEWLEEADRLGFNVLVNAHTTLSHNNEKVVLAGVTDYSEGKNFPGHESDPQKALSGAAAAGIKILLAHQPRSIYKASSLGYDLQLSGHTHGGQYIPWNMLVTLNQPFVKGLHKFQNTWVYVSRGTGYWGPPIRTGVPSEVTLLTLRKS